jgi:hypothetical protein
MNLRIEREYIEVSMLSPRDPDPRWRFVDAAGHEHHWDGDRTPTLEPKLERQWWCEDCMDEHEDWVLACAQCGEVITPMTVPGQPVQRIPGPVSYYLDDEPITKEQADTLLATKGQA